MEKLNKNQIRLIRIVVCAIAFLVIFVVEKTSDIIWYADLIVYMAIYFAIGYDVLWRAVRNIAHGQIFDENFLMSIATIGAFATGEYPEAVAVMLLYQIGELFQNYAVGKSRKSISSLMNIRPENAVVLREGQEVEVLPEEVNIGDVLVVRAGEKVPVDGVVIKGEGSVDTSALTGESMPRAVYEGSEILSGTINLSGVLHIGAKKEYCDSTVAKILDMVENASEKKAKAENFITRFARYYTPFVVMSAIFLAVIPPLVTNIHDGAVWAEWLKRALTFLVISCPCALVISTPMSFFGGIGNASRKGILFKGTCYLEMLEKANVYVFDKTGTLTKGKFEVVSVVPESNKEEILRVASIAESGSLHPIAKSITSAYGNAAVSADYEVKELAGRGMVAKGAKGSI
ncbi:MAG: cadmium family heavy metal-translocating P-type ATPase, partial [Eubacteriales bacterium]|nr:cadmium family heavy metal-translocating P-type ATPase [Eubacteriales bacterium]